MNKNNSFALYGPYSEYKKFPPYPFLIDVLKNALLSLRVYIELWDMQDDFGRIAIDKKEIKKTFLISPTLFYNKVLSLVDLSLLSVDESPNMIVVDLVQWHDDNELDDELDDRFPR